MFSRNIELIEDIINGVLANDGSTFDPALKEVLVENLHDLAGLYPKLFEEGTIKETYWRINFRLRSGIRTVGVGNNHMLRLQQ